MRKGLLLLFLFSSLAYFGKAQITLDVLSSFQTGVFDEGAAEIVAYDPMTQRVFFTNANANSVSVLDISDPSNPQLIMDIDQSPYGGGVNSVDVANGIVAVAVEADNKQENGVVTLWDTDGNFLNSVAAGALPDMLTFAMNGNYLVVANEGEPNDDYTVDPEGSVTIIELMNGPENAVATQVTFESLGDKATLVNMGVRIYGPNATAQQDLEPEYIDVVNGVALVACQENNAIIAIDLATKSVIGITPLGTKDHSIEGFGFDGSDKDGEINITTHPVMGLYLPDAIKAHVINGLPYVFTANEGDSRDYDGYSEEVRLEDLTLDPTAYPDGDALLLEMNLGRLKTTTAYGDTDGDGDVDQIVSYGARSFTIWNPTTGEVVFDSGDDFERITAEKYPNNFNANNDDNEAEGRSDDKGPEPEAIEVAEMGDKIYAFIGMERMGGIFIYDVTDPANAHYVDYVNNRNFEADPETPEAGDLGVEDIRFIAAEDSPNGKALILTANEVSGTVSIFEVKRKGVTSLFDEEIEITDYEPLSMVMPPSPLTMEPVFIGGYDIVQSTATYGNPAGKAVAKEWHDFIGFTADETEESIGWVVVNHEQVYRDDRLGDGGGMTAFRINKDAEGNIVVMDQTLDDGRQGQFFNVDFVNTVGETGMNCGGIVGPNGRIWTAEEWYRGSTSSIWNSSARTNSLPYQVAGLASGYGIRDTSYFTINTPEFPLVDGMEIPKVDNFNYMTEVDPKQAMAIRKQYNWGRAGWEGGAISNDGKYVYLGIDATPAPWVRFEADTPFDFTSGTLTVYKQDNPADERWIEVPETVENVFGGLSDYALSVGATMFVRNEWVTIDRETGIIYWTETGRDSGSSGPGIIFSAVRDAGSASLPAAHHTDLAIERGFADAFDTEYQDYYGRVCYYDPATHEVGVAVAGGPYFETSPTVEDYPNKHLSNPDGLSVMTIDGVNFLMIQEDLNGRSFGRMPEGISNSMCELYLLDTRLAKNADVDDLIRITAIPRGAEITGGIQIDENTIFVNAQHPNPNNPFPFNHSVTVAIHGFADIDIEEFRGGTSHDDTAVQINKISREAVFTYVSDFAVYNDKGSRIRVFRNTNTVAMDQLENGKYVILDADKNAFEIELN